MIVKWEWDNCCSSPQMRWYKTQKNLGGVVCDEGGSNGYWHNCNQISRDAGLLHAYKLTEDEFSYMSTVAPRTVALDRGKGLAVILARPWMSSEL